MNIPVRELEQMSDLDRAFYLQKLLNNLERYECNKGQEGCVYFINKDYIVKKYDRKKNAQLMDGIFEAYCEENNIFANMGYNIPKIFAWLKVPTPLQFSEDVSYDYYILEQRIEGKTLYIGKLDGIYEYVSDVFSKIKFDSTILAPRLFSYEYKEIIKKYIELYISMNERLISMNDAEIQLFIETMFAIFKEGEFNFPDVHAKNVIMTKESLFLIDNYAARKKNLLIVNKYSDYEFMFSRIFLLFRQNTNVRNLKNSNLEMLGVLTKDVVDMIDENMDLCTSALEKMLKAMKKCCANSKLPNINDYRRACGQLTRLLDRQRAEELLSSFEFVR